MAAFSSFSLDSSPPLFLPNPPHNLHSSYSPQSYRTLPNNSNNDNSASTTMDMYSSSSVVTDRLPAATKRKCRKGPCANSPRSKKKVKNGDEGTKESKGRKDAEKEDVGYIHVRARRGQATDSHSLAERVRRERIGARMKTLQALVPGCDKVTGKVLMLDEIINYVQSLQNQVEFLSMKLASVNLNPLFYDCGMDMAESFMISPDHQDLNNSASPLPNMLQECTLTAANSFHPLENSANSSQTPQAQNPNLLHHGSGHVLWEMDEQMLRQIKEIFTSQNSAAAPCFHSIYDG